MNLARSIVTAVGLEGAQEVAQAANPWLGIVVAGSAVAGEVVRRMDTRITIEGKAYTGPRFRRLYEDDASRVERFTLPPEAIDLDQTLRNARQAWLQGDFSQSVETMVDSLHVIDVTGPDPDRWGFIHLGKCTYASQVAAPVLSGIPFKSFRRQAYDSYFQAKLMAEPVYSFLKRRTTDTLAYRRLILPETVDGRVERLIVFIAVEYKPVFSLRPRKPKIRRWTTDGKIFGDYPDWISSGIACRELGVVGGT